MAPVCSTVAHAKLLSVDPTAALALPGVVRFLDVKDVPEGLTPFKIFGGQDEELFAKDTVMYEGHPIGAILACNESVARKATSLVKVEYEILKPVVSIDDAIEANSYIDVSLNVMFFNFKSLLLVLGGREHNCDLLRHRGRGGSVRQERGGRKGKDRDNATGALL